MIISNLIFLFTCLPAACPSWSGKTCNFHGTCLDGDLGNGTCACDVSILHACLSYCSECLSRSSICIFIIFVADSAHNLTLRLMFTFLTTQYHPVYLTGILDPILSCFCVYYLEFGLSWDTLQVLSLHTCI